jgi:hypothetical protein
MIMSPSFLGFYPTSPDGEFDLNLRPEALDALRFKPRSDLESDRPIGFGIRGRERSKKSRHGSRRARRRSPSFYSSVRVRGRVECWSLFAGLR